MLFQHDNSGVFDYEAATSIDSLDSENIPIEDVFRQLKCTRKGLTTVEAETRIAVFGMNKLEEKKETKILKFLGFMWNPLAWVMEAAAVMSMVFANGGGLEPGWPGFLGILILLLIYSTISYVEETNAENVVAALIAGVVPKAKVLRDEHWRQLSTQILVPGDIISIKLGDIVPADVRLLEGDPLKIDQYSLTGECLSVTKKPGDEVFSGSICKHGEIEAVVVATGVHTFFGKTAHLVDSTNKVGHFQEVFTCIGTFCIYFIAVAVIVQAIEIIKNPKRKYWNGINNILAFIIGGIPIAMPTVLSMTMGWGSRALSEKGVITKRMTVIEDLAAMDVLCSDKTGTLTLNKLTAYKNLIQTFGCGIDKDNLVLLAARASRIENQDSVDAAIVGMLDDSIQARADINPVDFLPFNPVYKRTTLTYIDADGNWHRVSKGKPEQILELAHDRDVIAERVHTVIDKFAERGLHSLAVAKQEVPEKNKESAGGPWTFCGVIPLFDPPRMDSAGTIREALNLGVNVKMITCDQLAIAIETGRRLGMGTNMYPSSSLMGMTKSVSMGELPIEELIEDADGFTGVFPEHKYEIVRLLQEKKHTCGVTGDGMNDTSALKKANIGIAVHDATDAAQRASDIVLMEPGLKAIVTAVLTSRAVLERMKNYIIYAISITVRTGLGFLLIALLWEFNFSLLMVLILTFLNDVTIMAISKNRVKPSSQSQPFTWNLDEIFTQGFLIGVYLALTSVVFFWVIHITNFFPDQLHVRKIKHSRSSENSALFLQASIISQAQIFFTITQGCSIQAPPGTWLMISFVVTQSIATLITVYTSSTLTDMEGIGWGWAGAIWLYSIISYIPLDLSKFAIRCFRNRRGWDLVFDNKTAAFFGQKEFGRVKREAEWACAERTLQGLDDPTSETAKFGNFLGKGGDMVEQALRRAEIARLHDRYTMKGHSESVALLERAIINTKK